MSDEMKLDTKPLLIDSGDNEKSAPNSKKRAIIIVLVVLITLLLCFAIIQALLKSPNDSPPNYPGTYGKWPTYGGNIQNQQIVPSNTDLFISQQNVYNLTLDCQYTSIGGRGLVGYITIDDENNAYFTDLSGYITKLNLDSCQEIWRASISSVLGYNESILLLQKQTVTLFQNSKGTKALIFGVPRFNINNSDGCYAVALHCNNGSLLWSLLLTNSDTVQCGTHGFMVSDHYAYGGLSGGDENVYFRGRFFKIDIDVPKIIDIWYTIDDRFSTINSSDHYIYSGVSAWNYPAIIDQYVVFGTGNLYTYPKYIEDCLLGNFSALNINFSYHYNPCNENMLDNKWWRCLENNIYCDSFVILNKNGDDEFKLEKAIPLQGVDVDKVMCRGNITTEQQIEYKCMKVMGTDSDLAAVATFRNNLDGKLYAAAMQKSGQFYVFSVPDGNVIISKRIGPCNAGGGLWSIAIDEKNMIAIASITGGNLDTNSFYKTHLLNGSVVCSRTGTIHGIDLNTGYTKWQIINPYNMIDDECVDDKWDNYRNTVYYNVSQQTCERDVYGNSYFDEILSDENVHIPPMDNEYDIPFIDYGRNTFIAPVTIVNDMVFIASFTGDVFIHDLFDGHYIHTLQCPTYLLNETIGLWNRAAIKGGITVFEDRVAFYCGGENWNGMYSEGNQLISMKLRF